MFDWQHNPHVPLSCGEQTWRKCQDSFWHLWLKPYTKPHTIMFGIGHGGEDDNQSECHRKHFPRKQDLHSLSQYTQPTVVWFIRFIYHIRCSYNAVLMMDAPGYLNSRYILLRYDSLCIWTCSITTSIICARTGAMLLKRFLGDPVLVNKRFNSSISSSWRSWRVIFNDK